MKDKVLVTSYVNPDLDGIASSYAYAELLRKTGINAVAGIFGKPHTEAEFVFSKIDVKLMKGDKLIKACDGVVLVDVSSAHNMSKKINPKKVVEIIDHREQKARDFPNAKMQIERVGACATLIAEKFYDKKIKISKESALFLYSAIVSNTINFKGRVTTKRDKNLAEWLKQFFEMPKNHVYEMFKYKSKIGSSLKRFMIQDFKVIY
ncbi:MAG TPA: DHH family phosphoesterase, partial [Candidatus Nanoarchaeia archaeon]|nr:DHH family phosphoesterase [Candidatus Nanoarchaeia archaeon]